MSEAITSLTQKGIFIFDSEAEAVQAAILMHDIGHGPFSHVLENTLIHGIAHEEISLMMMEKMNREMKGMLTLAINIFKDRYPKRFLHQLISSHLANEGHNLFAPPALHYFLYNHIDRETFLSREEALTNYELLDDNDIWSSVKVWMSHEDKILSLLSRSLKERKIFKVEVRDEP